MRDRVDSVIECGSLIYPTHPTYRVVSAGEATTIRACLVRVRVRMVLYALFYEKDIPN